MKAELAALFRCLVMAVVLSGSCLGASANTLVIVNSGSGAAYGELAESVRAELSRYAGVKVQVEELSQQAEPVRLPDDTFMVLAVGVQAMQHYARNGDPRLPVLSVLVPSSAFNALPSSLRSSRRMSALFIDQPLPRQVDLIRIVLPSAKTIGVVFGPSTQGQFELLRSTVASRGLSLVREVAMRDAELYPALQSVLSSADVLLPLPDPHIINAVTAQNLLLTSFRFRVPVIAYSSAYVRAGALAAVHSTARQIGQEAAQIARQVLRTTALPAAKYPKYFSVAVNRQLAGSLGLELPADGVILQRLLTLEPAE